MTITINLWIIPVGITLTLLVVMFRPYHRTGDYDFGEIFGLFWLIPIGFVWAAYFGVLYWLK